MMDFKVLCICNIDIAVQFYQSMIEENISRDERLKSLKVDEKSVRNLLQYSYGTEDDLFYLAYIRNTPVGFIDSSKVLQENAGASWFIKAVYLLPAYRTQYFFELMLAKVEKKVKSKGISKIFSTALIDDKTANRFWENAGYSIEERKRIKNM